MKTLLKSKQSVKDMPFSRVQSRRQERRWQFIGRACKIILLLAALGGLSAFFLLHPMKPPIFPLIPQATTCPEMLGTADYPQMVNLQPQSQQMTAVQLVNNLAGDAPAALVQVTNHDAQNSLDIYIFGCVLRGKQPRLVPFFIQRGLGQGTVVLTPDHKLIVKTLDAQIPSGTVPFLQPLQQNIYHEYAWQQGSFEQVPFAGFYPVTSRVEAEALQQNADGGQVLPWSDPLKTARQMSKDLLHWSPEPQAQLISQVGDTAVVALTHQNPHIELLVTLKQLIQQDNAGLWFVTDARTRGMLLTEPGTLDQPLAASQSSPIHFSGASALLDGQTSATLFDHTLTPVSQATDVPLAVHADSSYAGTLTYTHLAPGQQGVLLVESLPTAANFTKESGQMLLTGILLN